MGFAVRPPTPLRSQDDVHRIQATYARFHLAETRRLERLPTPRRNLRPKTFGRHVLSVARCSLYPLSIPTTGQALNITCTSSDDQIVFGLTGCRRTVPDLHPMLDQLDAELDLLETAVGL